MNIKLSTRAFHTFMTLLRDINTIGYYTTRLMSFRLQTQSQNVQEIRRKKTNKLLG